MRFVTQLFLFLFIAIIGHGDARRSGKTPVWSTRYSLTGTLYLPYAEIAEPYRIWYDSNTQQSRIDYYHGTVKTYQLPRKYQYGTSIKIAPVTTETETNVQTCLQVNGTSDGSVAIQSLLPALDGFAFIGTHSKNGIDAEKWQLVEKVGTKVNTYKMWLTYNYTQQQRGSAKVAIPIRYEMLGFDSLIGSHYDHYYLDYENYDISPINPNVFSIKSHGPCVAFPGPGDMHLAAFNPMAEYIYPVATSHVDKAFDKFKGQHGKSYSSNSEQQQRKHIFTQNFRFIQSFNRQNKGYTVAVNHLADRTNEEIHALNGRVHSEGYNGGAPFPHTTIDSSSFPSQFDWRLLGAVTEVKDQAICGSCWSFGTVGAIEGAYFLKSGGQLLRFSEQALMDCSWGYGNNACDGGEDFRSYQWMMKHGGIPTYDDYGPYLGQDGYCHANSVPLYAKITGYVNVTTNSEAALKLAILKHGPISVSIDASHKSFTFYSHGVYYEPQCGSRNDQLDHSVLAVGYGRMNGQDYWLIKNSWSNYWGDEGYVLMSARRNNCGVMTCPTYVTM